jgi:hypothetical protein
MQYLPTKQKPINGMAEIHGNSVISFTLLNVGLESLKNLNLDKKGKPQGIYNMLIQFGYTHLIGN